MGKRRGTERWEGEKPREACEGDREAAAEARAVGRWGTLSLIIIIHKNNVLVNIFLFLNKFKNRFMSVLDKYQLETKENY